VFNILCLYLFPNICSCFSGASLGVGCTSKKTASKHILLCHISISFFTAKTYHFMPLIPNFYSLKSYGLTSIFHIFLPLKRYVFSVVLHSFYCLLDSALSTFCYLPKTYKFLFLSLYAISHKNISLYFVQ